MREAEEGGKEGLAEETEDEATRKEENGEAEETPKEGMRVNDCSKSRREISISCCGRRSEGG